MNMHGGILVGGGRACFKMIKLEGWRAKGMTLMEKRFPIEICGKKK